MESYSILLQPAAIRNKTRTTFPSAFLLILDDFNRLAELQALFKKPNSHRNTWKPSMFIVKRLTRKPLIQLVSSFFMRKFQLSGESMEKFWSISFRLIKLRGKFSLHRHGRFSQQIWREFSACNSLRIKGTSAYPPSSSSSSSKSSSGNFNVSIVSEIPFSSSSKFNSTSIPRLSQSLRVHQVFPATSQISTD